MVALIFDVRQSKRLFSIVSAGDVPAKMVGYLIALAFTSIIGTENLLWIAAGCMVVAGFIFAKLSRSDEMKQLAPSSHHHYATQSLQNIQAAIMGNTLIRQVAVVSFFSFCFYIIVNFVLYGYVKNRFSTDKSLALFFAVFFAVSRFITLMIKLFVTNRLVNNIGLRRAILIAPVLLLVLSAVACGIRAPGASFYIFGVMAVSADILRSAIQSPVLLATLQPLAAPQRLRGHTIIKGLMDPFAYLASGILLLFVIASTADVNFMILSWILLSICVVWIVACLFVDKNYIKMLAAAIRQRTLDGRTISITDSDSLMFLLAKMKTGDEKEAISVLQLVSSQPVDRQEFYRKALDHHSENVRKLALQLILEQRYHYLLPDLKEMMYQRPQASDLHYFVRAVGLLDKTENISPFLAHENPNVANAAALALLSHTDESKRGVGEQYLLKLFESNDSERQLQALKIVNELKADKYAEQVYQIIQEKENTNRSYALQTAGSLGNEKLIDHLLRDFLGAEKTHDILDALRLAGNRATERIKPLLQPGICGLSKRRKLFALLGKIDSNTSTSLLLDSVERFPEDAGFLFSILYQVKYRNNASSALFKKWIIRTLETASVNLFKLHFLQGETRNFSLLARALDLELAALKDRCIHLFSFLYDVEKINRAKNGFDIGTKESVANSFELIETIVPKEYASWFTAIFEDGELSYKVSEVKKFHKSSTLSIKNIVESILVEQRDHYNDWTKACLLYTLREDNGTLKKEITDYYLHSDNPIIKEIAETIVRERAEHYS